MKVLDRVPMVGERVEDEQGRSWRVEDVVWPLTNERPRVRVVWMS